MNACAKKDTKGYAATTTRSSSFCKFAYHQATSQPSCGWIGVVLNAHNIKKHGSFGWHDKCADRWKTLCLLFYQPKPRLLIHHIPTIYDQHYEILIWYIFFNHPFLLGCVNYCKLYFNAMCLQKMKISLYLYPHTCSL